MPMLISKFHRLIQSRLLWASFLVIIVFSFVIWVRGMPSANRAARESSAAGKLNGQYVSQQEYRNAYFNPCDGPCPRVVRNDTQAGQGYPPLRLAALHSLRRPRNGDNTSAEE